VKSDYLTYEDAKELLQEQIDRCFITTTDKMFNSKHLQEDYLNDYDYYALAECERLNAILALMVWQCNQNQVTKEIEGELLWYYKEYTEGRLESLLQEHEKGVVLHDFLECYHKVFG